MRFHPALFNQRFGVSFDPNAPSVDLSAFGTVLEDWDFADVTKTSESSGQITQVQSKGSFTPSSYTMNAVGTPTVSEINGRRCVYLNGSSGFSVNLSTLHTPTVATGGPGVVVFCVMELDSDYGEFDQAIIHSGYTGGNNQHNWTSITPYGSVVKSFVSAGTTVVRNDTMAHDLKDGLPHLTTMRDKISGTGSGIWIHVDGANPYTGGDNHVKASTSNQNQSFDRTSLGFKSKDNTAFVRGKLGRIVMMQGVDSTDIPAIEAALKAEWGIVTGVDYASLFLDMQQFGPLLIDYDFSDPNFARVNGSNIITRVRNKGSLSTYDLSTIVGTPGLTTINGHRAGLFDGASGLRVNQGSELRSTVVSGFGGTGNVVLTAFQTNNGTNGSSNQTLFMSGYTTANNRWLWQILQGSTGYPYKHMNAGATTVGSTNPGVVVTDNQPHLTLRRESISGTVNVWWRVDGAPGTNHTETSPGSTSTNQNTNVDNTTVGYQFTNGSVATGYLSGRIGRVVMFGDPNSVDHNGAEAALADYYGISI